MKIKYGRRSVCMSDDAMNGIYEINMPDDSTLADLIRVLTGGGYGNTWPIPTTSAGWVICSDIGELAVLTDDNKRIEYCGAAEDTKLSALGIHWVYGEREGTSPDIAALGRHFD